MTAMMQTVKVKFTEEYFTSLQMRRWTPGWNHVGLYDLIDDEMGFDDSTYLTLFLNNCIDPSTKQELKENDVLLVKASEKGFFDRVYGPIIRSSEDETSLVLCSGGNVFPIEQTKEGKFKLGLLVGDIEVSDLEIIDKDTQQKRIISIPRIDFKLPSDRSIVYSIPLFTKEKVDGEVLKDLGRSGESIAQYLKPTKGTGSYSVSRWNEIQSGEYKVTGFDKELKTNENGAWTSYTIHLENDKATWINKQLSNLLDGKLEVYKNHLKAGKPVTLIVEKKLGKDGKTVYTNGFLITREPHAALPSTPVAVKSLASAEPAAIDVTAKASGIPQTVDFRSFAQAKKDINGDDSIPVEATDENDKTIPF